MLAYRIDLERRLIVLTGSGAVMADEVRAIQNRVRADPAFDPAFNALTDFRDVTAFQLGSGDMRSLAANAPLHPAARRAFVVRGDLGYGMMRMYESFFEGVDGGVRLFRDDLDAALQWLLEPPRS